MRVLFFGTPHFSVPTLECLIARSDLKVTCVVTQPDKPVGRGNLLTAPPIKEIALKNDIPVVQPRSLRKTLPESLEQLAAYGPYDIGVVIAFGQILPREVLELPRCGCVNLHASLLPRWRGAAPVQRALLEGDTETGICLMKMDEGLDTGAVFATESTPILKDETSGSLAIKLSQLGANLLDRKLLEILRGELKATPQPEQGATYAKKLTSEEALISWDKPSELIDRQIRGFAPAPGAYTTLTAKRLKIFSAETEPFSSGTPPQPGMIVAIEPHRIGVASSTGIVYLKEIQLEGKKRMKCDEFVRGNSVGIGMRLGD